MSPAAAQTETMPLSGGSSLVLTKLNDNGSNWIDYKTRMLIALGSWSLRGYIEGTAVPTMCYNTIVLAILINENPTIAC